ncbi:MAG: carbamoyltransferase C-terminal domain-containing protein, partial [Myxococcota bacterium]|nr:carbamoyltransferase C-terminal domain-containing protein [Myxococcota bacterium]
DIINAKVKFRELWRPFCPSATVEDGPLYFDYAGELPYMIVACDARPDMENRIPSVIHCDHTVRVQSVSRTTNPRFHSLIHRFKALTGYGVVLNTSFNVKGEPIVCAPQDAVDTFLKSGIDVLAIGNYLAWKAE